MSDFRRKLALRFAVFLPLVLQLKEKKPIFSSKKKRRALTCLHNCFVNFLQIVNIVVALVKLDCICNDYMRDLLDAARSEVEHLHDGINALNAAAFAT